MDPMPVATMPTAARGVTRAWRRNSTRMSTGGPDDHDDDEAYKIVLNLPAPAAPPPPPCIDNMVDVLLPLLHAVYLIVCNLILFNLLIAMFKCAK